MIKQLKKITFTVSVIFSVMMFSLNAYADENIKISADKEVCEVGDKVSFTLSANAQEGSATPPQISVEYNYNRLSFDSCSVEYGGGGGGLITINDTEATIDFTVLSGGETSVSVSAILGDNAVTETAEAVISVNGEDIAASMGEQETSSTGVEASTIATSDGKLVQTVFADEFMPVLFHKATCDYQGQTVESAQFDMADLTLLYMTDAQGADGRFYIYNTLTGDVSDFRMIQGIENRFIIVLNECEGDIPNGYTKAVLDWNGQTLAAYMNMSAANGGLSSFDGLNTSDFFLVYALSSEGKKGWYQYDQSEGSYQRFLQYIGANGQSEIVGDSGVATNISDSDETFLDGFMSAQLQMILLLVFAALTLILIIVVIILGIKCSEYNDYEYVDPEEYYRDNDTSRASANEGRVKGTVTAAKIVEQTFADDEDGDEPEEDDDANDKNENSISDDEDAIAQADDNADDVVEKNESVEDTRKKNTYRREEDDEDEEEDDDVDDYFAPRMSRREEKALEKQRRREEKEAEREEKWRQKEERKAAKMREKGYEESSPMDWGAFTEDMSNAKDSRRPMGKSNLPSYMQKGGEAEDDERDDMTLAQNKVQNDDEGMNQDDVYAQDRSVKESRALPPRKNIAPVSAQSEEESAKKIREDEQRRKQKRLFEQQQMIEEQRRIEREQYEQQQRLEQEKFVLSQRVEDQDLDEDFQFEFLNL